MGASSVGTASQGPSGRGAAAALILGGLGSGVAPGGLLCTAEHRHAGSICRARFDLKLRPAFARSWVMRVQTCDRRRPRVGSELPISIRCASPLARVHVIEIRTIS